ncbi:MAG: glycosyltransferase, partial [Bacteroidota bacterium]|nr:glycosyltransferase [Bacteroidota bacterium]
MTAFYNPFSYRRINRWLNIVKPDVVHIHNWHYSASPAIIRAVKKRGIPVVHTLHNFRLLCPSGTMLHNNVISSDYLRNRFPWQSVRNRAYRNSYLQTFWLASVIWFHKTIGTWKSVDKFIALTEHAKSIFQSSDIFTKEKIVVKPNFIANIPSEECERQSHFLFTGRLSVEKGLDVLLTAFANSGHTLKIIGDGPLRGLVENYVSNHKNIIYLGFKNKNEIINELKVCT